MDDDKKISGKFTKKVFEQQIQAVHGKVSYAPHSEREWSEKIDDFVMVRMRLYYNEQDNHVGTWQKGHGWYAKEPIH